MIQLQSGLTETRTRATSNSAEESVGFSITA